MKNGYTPITIKKESQSRYYEVLDDAHMTMNYKPFLEFVVGSVEESEQLWLSLLEQKIYQCHSKKVIPWNLYSKTNTKM